MPTFIERWCWTLDFLGGSPSVTYPLWLRRFYIVTWPVAAPIRFVLFFVDIVLFLGMLAIVGGTLAVVHWIADCIDYLSHQWRGEQ